MINILRREGLHHNLYPDNQPTLPFIDLSVAVTTNDDDDAISEQAKKDGVIETRA